MSGESEQVTIPRCVICGRSRGVVGMDVYDYNPLQMIANMPLGWYSGDDGEFCPEDITKMIRGDDPEPSPTDQIIDLWNANNGWIPGAHYRQLAEILGVGAERLVHWDHAKRQRHQPNSGGS